MVDCCCSIYFTTETSKSSLLFSNTLTIFWPVDWLLEYYAFILWSDDVFSLCSVMTYSVNTWKLFLFLNTNIFCIYDKGAKVVKFFSNLPKGFLSRDPVYYMHDIRQSLSLLVSFNSLFVIWLPNWSKLLLGLMWLLMYRELCRRFVKV